MYSTAHVGSDIHAGDNVISGNGSQIYAITFSLIAFFIIIIVVLAIIIMVCYNRNVRSKILIIGIRTDDGPVKDGR